MKTCVLALVVVFVLANAGHLAAETPATAQLHGLRSFSIAVSLRDFSDVAAFSTDRWQRLELDLARQASALVEEHGFRTEIVEWVHGVNLNALEIGIVLQGTPDASLYAFGVTIGFREAVRLERSPDLDLPEGGVTWSRSRVELQGPELLADAVAAAVEELMEGFVGALLFENGGEMQREREQK